MARPRGRLRPAPRARAHGAHRRRGMTTAYRRRPRPLVGRVEGRRSATSRGGPATTCGGRRWPVRPASGGGWPGPCLCITSNGVTWTRWRASGAPPRRAAFTRGPQPQLDLATHRQRGGAVALLGRLTPVALRDLGRRRRLCRLRGSGGHIGESWAPREGRQGHLIGSQAPCRLGTTARRFPRRTRRPRRTPPRPVRPARGPAGRRSPRSCRRIRSSKHQPHMDCKSSPEVPSRQLSEATLRSFPW